MLKQNPYSEVTQELHRLSDVLIANGQIAPELYGQHDVKRGLRDINGKGVLTGLTRISEVRSTKTDENGNSVPCEGELYYRGYNVEDLINGSLANDQFGFEEISYLLYFGQLPTKAELQRFQALLASYRTLPTNFVRDVVMKAPTADMMNALARSVLTLYGYDDNANDTSIPNVLRQCLQLTAIMPMLTVYAYRSYRHFVEGDSLFIHPPVEGYSTAQSILHFLRPDSKFTALEAEVLDVALMLHAEHGGGNNSTFTVHVVSSSGTDTYSAIAAALGSLKGPKHGGANIMVMRMFDDIKQNVKDWTDETEIAAYLLKLLNKEAFDHSGLIYGMGHAVYSLSDPRANMLERFVKKLAGEKGREDEYGLYARVAKLAPQVISEKRKIYKGVSPNVDFYSGFVYSMLDLPLELYTPIFAVARMAGWGAHRLEELTSASKIIRPAYLNVSPRQSYVPIDER